MSDTSATGPLTTTVQSLVAQSWPGMAFELVESVDSTNLALQRRWREGNTTPQLLMARTQTAGRGRLGRQWQSQADASLTFSLGLPLPLQDWSGLSLAVGVAVAGALHPAVGLKWPNDLWVKGGDGRMGKLGGIMIASVSGGAGNGNAHSLLVIGIGLNIAPQPFEAVSVPPAFLQSLLPSITPLDALARLVPPLLAGVQQFLQTGFAPMMAAFASRDVLAGHAVVLSNGQQGKALGVDTDGALLLAPLMPDEGPKPTTVQRVVSGEVSVRLDSRP